jgi:hypothetical protein
MLKVLESLNRVHFRHIVWVLAISETLHNIEEAIWLPAWSHTAGMWHPSVTAFEFRFAVIATTLLFYGVIWYFSRYGTNASIYLLGGALVIILFNVFIPHLIATIALSQYAPGAISGILFNIPVTLYLLRRGMREGFFTPRELVLGTIVFTVVAGTLLPVSFAVGRLIDSLA